MTYRFHPEAMLEYSDAVLYYESRRPGLGLDFIKEIESGLELINQSVDRWPFFEDDFRRLLIKRFPYALIYEAEQDSFIVYAVMHCSRSPGYWKERT